MPILTLPLDVDGAVISVGFAVSGPRQAAMTAAGLTIPPPVIVRALVDTGASCTCLDPTVIAKLGLVPSGTVLMHTPSTAGTAVSCNQFDVAVGVIMDANEVHVPSMIIPVIESTLATQGIQALLGRDLLEKGILIYDGRRKSLTLAF
jgi:predicted aspartyl protease